MSKTEALRKLLKRFDDIFERYYKNWSAWKIEALEKHKALRKRQHLKQESKWEPVLLLRQNKANVTIKLFLVRV